MKHSLFWGITTLVVALFGVLGWYFYQSYQGAAPAVLPVPSNIADDIPDVNDDVPPGESINTTGMPLTLPDGFSIEILTDDMPGARAMAIGHDGSLYVSQIKEGFISKVSLAEGSLGEVETVFSELENPHGLAFDPSNSSILYIAEETQISRVDLSTEEKTLEPVAELPVGGRHVSRTLGFGPDGRLYVAIGSTCDVCEEQDDDMSTIQTVNIETGELEPYATGLRNSVFFAWHEVDGSMWATEMGRDNLGDDLPPDEINKIVEGGNYGWPICYGNKIHDTDFDTKQYIRNPCEDTRAPAVELQAHVAPLGMSIIPESTAWPEEYWYDLIVAEHGSWNRTEPVGYQLTRIPVSTGENGELVLGSPEPFISGWLTEEDRALGRPVGVLAQHDGTIYVTDDKAGVVYRVRYLAPERSDEPGGDTVRLNAWDGETIPLAVTNPITITGEARGPMFFEASFPVELIDDVDGLVARGIATATSDWMTEEFVSMEISLEIINLPAGPGGVLILHNDNPSGLPENDMTITYPVTFIAE